MPVLGDWLYTCDRKATFDAYAREERGGADTCTCTGCRNFVAVRARAFPRTFLEFLDSLGVDPHKDGEVYHYAQRAPGCHEYGGWFHFVGSLDRTGDFPAFDFGNGFTVSLSNSFAPAHGALQGQPLVEVTFNNPNVPWGLDEPELE
jgi:hypothetical protein